ncbi:hypothetical protein MKW98_022672 [Papaver atlanticum]|uniref:Uncharacterized protein n=1 Tax=Papaver atlanticum TaxID=357466 RepID=A0AAD4T3Z3_9MAGN|nr:hypothetical protein MKW98_022672 [Papaver atlanticum]
MIKIDLCLRNSLQTTKFRVLRWESKELLQEGICLDISFSTHEHWSSSFPSLRSCYFRCAEERVIQESRCRVSW